MNEIRFLYTKGLTLPASKVLATLTKLKPEIQAMNKVNTKGYADERASINLVHDKDSLSLVKKTAAKFKTVKLVVVVGIGGSNLGTLAVFEAIKGKLHNLQDSPQMLFADTVDPDSMNDVTHIVKQYLSKKKKVLICLVTKSGGTTETIANFEILYTLLQKYQKKPSVVAITDEGSPLWDFAQEKKFTTLPVPDNVGGRYSVFSAVGLFPLAVAGISIDKLIKGAAAMQERCLHAGAKNPAAVSASLLYNYYKKKKNIADLFLFSNNLESVGKWYRQLLGESIGKEHNRKGRKVHVGITPTVSIGSTDLHSLAQLYLGGPQDKFTTIVRVENYASPPRVPYLNVFEELVPHIQGRPLSQIMDAIIEGVKAALRNKKRPFCEIVLPDISERAIGQLLQLKMMEVMYLGHLLDVNPFDQPNVEEYKGETREI